MKRIFGLIGALVLVLAVAGAVWAAETKEEKALNKQAGEISATAKTSQGEKVVMGRLEKEFNVTDTQVQGLRDKKLGYGEIAVVLSLSSKMAGGVTDANIQQVMTLRQGPPTMGWGEIAKKLGAKLGPTVSQVRTMNRETSREMKGGKEQGMGSHQGQQGNMGHEGMGREGAGGGSGMSHGKGR
ncbi:MAG: hypothetical protein M0Z89_09810 [Nitrospiraceae bacterium]|nr:hypothetical protein [Nitrospiraceae bacterium]